MILPEKRNPPGQAGIADAKTGRAGRTVDDTAGRLPSNWRERLLAPAVYYGSVVVNLSVPNTEGYARGRCPFHPDEANSLAIHVGDSRGAWRCEAGCGGGDLIGFHQRLTGLYFKAAVRDLLRVTP